MTEEQMEILRKQIAMYAVICGQLVSHESLSSKLPVSSGTTEMLVSFKIVKTASAFVIRLRHTAHVIKRFSQCSLHYLNSRFNIYPQAHQAGQNLVSVLKIGEFALGMNPTGGGYFDSIVASPSTYKISHRHRWTPTSMQLQIFESIYEEGSGTPKPQRIKEIMMELSQHGQVMDKNVYNWFQNRRPR
ncbi:hypothetical protein YC2023_090333 [Brassica napus]